MENILNEDVRKSRRENVKKRYAQKIQEILPKAGFGNKSTLAYRLLDNREALSTNAKGSSQDIAKVNALVQEYHELYEICVFCASFPSNETEITTGKGVPKFLTPDQDRQSRNCQFVNFITQHLKLIQESSKHYSYEKAFYEYGAFLKEINDFLNEKGRNTKEIFIILLGHGVKQGAILLDETHPIPWDVMLSNIENLSKQRLIKDKLVPETLHIVFTQCMAHCGKRQNSIREFVSIKAFTGPENEVTFSSIVMDGGEVKNANHEDLNEWGNLWFERKEKIASFRHQLNEFEDIDVALGDIIVWLRDKMTQMGRKTADVEEHIKWVREQFDKWEDQLDQLMEDILSLWELMAEVEQKPSESEEEVVRLMDDIARDIKKIHAELTQSAKVIVKFMGEIVNGGSS